MEEHEDHDPVGIDPEQVFTDFAVEFGLIKAGESLPLPLWQYTMAIVERCACIGDRYDGHGDHNAGEEIRAIYGEP